MAVAVVLGVVPVAAVVASVVPVAMPDILGSANKVRGCGRPELLRDRAAPAERGAAHMATAADVGTLSRLSVTVTVTVAVASVLAASERGGAVSAR